MYLVSFEFWVMASFLMFSVGLGLSLSTVTGRFVGGLGLIVISMLFVIDGLWSHWLIQLK